MPPKAKKVVEEEYDPFAPGQDDVPGGDEAQTEMEWTGSFEVDNMEIVMNKETPDQNHCTMILKGKGYDAPSISIRGGNIEDLHKQVFDNAKLLEELIQRAAVMGKTFNEAFAGSEKSGGGGYTNRGQNSSQGGSQGRTQGKPAQATAHPKGRQEFCQHGEMEFKTGLGKNDKMWGAFDCKVDPKGCPKGRVWDNDFGK